MITLALVLTPVASARALAALCALDGIDVDVVPTPRGAVAVRAVGSLAGAGTPGGGGRDAAGASAPDEAAGSGAAEGEPGPLADAADWDISELLEDDDVPAEARELAARISQLTRVGVVLVTARLTEDGGLEPGLSGQISAQRYLGGEPGEDLAAGLVLAGADDVVEDLLLGRRAVTDVPGHVSSRDAGRPRGRRLGRRLRRPGT